MYYSGFTEEHILPGHKLLVEKLSEHGFSERQVCKKYATKKFLKASAYAVEWAQLHLHETLGEEMNVEC